MRLIDLLSREPYDTRLLIEDILRLCEPHRPNRIARLRFADIFGNEAVLLIYEPLVGTGVVWVCLAYKPDNYTYYSYYVTTGADFINKAGTIMKSSPEELTLADLVRTLFNGANGFVRAYTPLQANTLRPVAQAVLSHHLRAADGKKLPPQNQLAALLETFPFRDDSERERYLQASYI